MGTNGREGKDVRQIVKREKREEWLSPVAAEQYQH